MGRDARRGEGPVRAAGRGRCRCGWGGGRDSAGSAGAGGRTAGDGASSAATGSDWESTGTQVRTGRAKDGGRVGGSDRWTRLGGTRTRRAPVESSRPRTRVTPEVRLGQGQTWVQKVTFILIRLVIRKH